MKRPSQPNATEASATATATATHPYGLPVPTQADTIVESIPPPAEPDAGPGFDPERFGAHEIPADLRRQLSATKLKEVSPERFQDTQPPNKSLLEAPTIPRSDAAAHDPKTPPPATELKEPEAKVIVAHQRTILSRRKRDAVAKDPEAVTLADESARLQEQRKAKARKLATLLIGAGAAILLAAVAIALWPRAATVPTPVVADHAAASPPVAEPTSVATTLPVPTARMSHPPSPTASSAEQHVAGTRAGATAMNAQAKPSAVVPRPTPPAARTATPPRPSVSAIKPSSDLRQFRPEE